MRVCPAAAVTFFLCCSAASLVVRAQKGAHFASVKRVPQDATEERKRQPVDLPKLAESLNLELEDDGGDGRTRLHREDERGNRTRASRERSSSGVIPIFGTENVMPDPSPRPRRVVNTIDLENSIRMFGILANPADPAGALGPKTLLTATNTGLVLQHPTTGKLIAAERPREFFLPVIAGDGRKYPLDVNGELEEFAFFSKPAAQYDPSSGRFFVAYLLNQCEQVLAVSKTSAPKSFRPKEWLIGRFPIDEREPSTIFNATEEQDRNRTVTAAILSDLLQELFGFTNPDPICQPKFYLSHHSLGVSPTILGFAYNVFDTNINVTRRLLGSRSAFIPMRQILDPQNFADLLIRDDDTPDEPPLRPERWPSNRFELGLIDENNTDILDKPTIEIVDQFGSLSLVPYVQVPEDQKILLGPVGSEIFASFDRSENPAEPTILQETATQLAGYWLYGFTNRGPGRPDPKQSFHTPLNGIFTPLTAFSLDSFLNGNTAARKLIFDRVINETSPFTNESRVDNPIKGLNFTDLNRPFDLSDLTLSELLDWDTNRQLNETTRIEVRKELEKVLEVRNDILSSLQSGILTVGPNAFFPAVQFDDPDEDTTGSQLGGFEISLGDDFLQSCRQTQLAIFCVWTGFRTIKDASLDKRRQQSFIAFAQLDVFTMFSRSFDALVPPPPQKAVTPIAIPALLTRAILPPKGWDYAYPSVAATASGDVLIGFTAFDRAGFPSAAYTFRPADCPDFYTPVIYKKGEAPYIRPTAEVNLGRMNLHPHKNVSAWGHGSATVNDPSDPSCLWTLQPYSKIHGPLTNGLLLPPGKGNWALMWAQVCVDPHRYLARRRLKHKNDMKHRNLQRTQQQAAKRKRQTTHTQTNNVKKPPDKDNRKVKEDQKQQETAEADMSSVFGSEAWLARQFRSLLSRDSARLGLSALLGRERVSQLDEFLSWRRDDQ